MTGSALRWLERALFAVAICSGAWCAVVLLESRYVQSLPPVRVTAHGAVIGRLELPSVHLATNILEGSDDVTLARGAGHIEDTALPGRRGNVGIAGHRDTVFRRLKGIRNGDPLNLTTADRVYRYRISRSLIVKPDAVELLDPTAEPTLTLVTCYPFQYIGHAPRRFVVQATLVGDEPRPQ